jgi:GNAT superfamily N-acetyltransferase
MELSPEMSGEVKVLPLGPGRLTDWLAFFDKVAFADNPDWSGCYCHFFHADHDEKPWDERTPEENRAASIDLIGKGRLRGYLAYLDGRPLGWCQAGPRAGIPNIANDDELVVEEADNVGSIVCFVVAESYRGKGVASALLEAACEGFSAAGLRWAEAYPNRVARTAAANYHGPMGLYAKSGFKPIREVGDFTVMRRDLAADETAVPPRRGVEEG